MITPTYLRILLCSQAVTPISIKGLMHSADVHDELFGGFFEASRRIPDALTHLEP